VGTRELLAIDHRVERSDDLVVGYTTSYLRPQGSRLALAGKCGMQKRML
jgi:hypothetical protein